MYDPYNRFVVAMGILAVLALAAAFLIARWHRKARRHKLRMRGDANVKARDLQKMGRR